MPEPPKTSQLAGEWERVTGSPCSRVYPRRLVFRPEGLYAGVGGAPGAAPGWDTGTWQVAGPGRVRIATANDAIITYTYALAGDRLTFVDPGGCRFEYRRVADLV